MKTCLINLHNHLIDPEGNFYDDKKIEEYFENSKKAKCSIKVYAFTDHFQQLIQCYHLNGLQKYKERLESIKKKWKEITILVGIELDVYFNNNSSSYNHMICIFGSFDVLLSKIKNFSENENNCQFSLQEPSKSWVELLEDAFCIPHYQKNTKPNRNFNTSQIDSWNAVKNLPKIRFLEIAANINTYWYFLHDHYVNKNQFYPIVANDREKSQLFTFMFFDDSGFATQHNDKTKIIMDIFTKSNCFSRLSSNAQNKFIVTINLNNKDNRGKQTKTIEVNISTNALIYGARGSGKSYLCSQIFNTYINQNVNNKIDDNDDVCYIRQGEFINQKLEEYFDTIIHETMQKINEITILLKSEFSNIYKKNKYTKKDVESFFMGFIDKVVNNIDKNISDNCMNLKCKLNKFDNIINYEENTTEINSFKFIENFVNKIWDLINEFDLHKEVLNGDTETIINNLYSLKDKLIEKKQYYFLRKEIKTHVNTMMSELKEIVQSDWKYTFSDINFYDYFLGKMIIEEFKKFREKLESDFIEIKTRNSYNGNKYALKLKLSSSKSDYFNLSLSTNKIKQKNIELCISKNNNFVNTSTGEEREFLFLDKILKKNYNFFIFDEPEYGFDNVFLKNVIVKKIHEIFFNQDTRSHKRCWVITHNQVFWSELFNVFNKLQNATTSYIHCEYDNGKYKYSQKNNADDCDFLTIYEAGNESYNMRGKIYNLKQGKHHEKS